jgi:hypothetical protein
LLYHNGRTRKYTMIDENQGPVYLAEALETLLEPCHDKYLVAAAAYLYPRTIQHIVTRRPIAQATLDKVQRAFKRGELSPKPSPPFESSGLADKVHRFLLSMGGTVQAAARLRVDPLVIAKVIYGRQVNNRFRALVQRRLEKCLSTVMAPPIAASHGTPEEVAEDSLAQCRQAYELYKSQGTLEAVGRRLHLSRERVRQLINRGVAYGVIPAEPHYTQAARPFPFSSREEFLAAYQETPSMRRLVRNLRVSKERLKRFCQANAVLQQELADIRRSSMRHAASACQRPIAAKNTIRMAS